MRAGTRNAKGPIYCRKSWYSVSRLEKSRYHQLFCCHTAINLIHPFSCLSVFPFCQSVTRKLNIDTHIIHFTSESVMTLNEVENFSNFSSCILIIFKVDLEISEAIFPFDFFVFAFNGQTLIKISELINIAIK